MKRDGAPVFGAVIAAGVAVLIAVGVGAWAAGHYSAKTVTVGVATVAAPSAQVDPAVAAGAHTFVQFACAQCHGDQGKGGVSPDVPALDVAGKNLTAAQLRHIIDHGLGVSGNPTRPYMPVWGAGDLDHAGERPDLLPPRRPARRAGRHAAGHADRPGRRGRGRRALRPLRLHQLPRPERPRRRARTRSRPDKTIPPLSGADFFNQFNTDAKIIDVIRSGSVIGKAPIVSMPHWGGIIPNQDLQALVAYIKTLKSS